MPLLKHNNNSISNVTSFPLVPSGSPTLLATATASSSASLSFNSTYINGDYQIYKFEFINCHPATSGFITFQVNAVGQTGFNETITSTFFHAYHDEADAYGGLTYDTGRDQAQSTSFCKIGFRTGNGADESTSGEMFLFNPSSPTFVKHFITRFASYDTGSYTDNAHVAGYINTTSAIDEIQFKFDSGNIDAGTIKLYGLGAN